ncbi:hypothetical protein [Peribacillus butanolivorans]|uniref:hypothetical protein n=1 Tax=Peribacillus butanolivorans TaxID=421767 RepID=UPI00167F44EF|nr:hypothetical protein [Peribacillus butanolivorans]QNU03292.1 hypothetical protein GM240_04590 [Peribacillus butanolivorans]
MVQTSSIISRAAVRGSASGLLFMAFFGTLWAGTGVMGLQGWGFPYVELAAVFVGITLIIGGISLIRASKRLSNQVSQEDARRWKRIRFWFNITFIAEGLAIGIAIAICNATNFTDLIPAIIALIVGIHFLPLAHLFQLRIYYVTGLLLCLLAIITLLVVPESVTLFEHQIIAPLSIIGFGSSLILWTTGLTIWLKAKKMLSLATLT